jgi:hypothetical protein
MSAKIKELLAAQGMTPETFREGIVGAHTMACSEMTDQGMPLPVEFIEAHADECMKRYDEFAKRVEHIVWEFITDEEADALIAFHAKWPELAVKQRKVARAAMDVGARLGAEAADSVLEKLDG